MLFLLSGVCHNFHFIFTRNFPTKRRIAKLFRPHTYSVCAEVLQFLLLFFFFTSVSTFFIIFNTCLHAWCRCTPRGASTVHQSYFHVQENPQAGHWPHGHDLCRKGQPLRRDVSLHDPGGVWGSTPSRGGT